MQYPLLVVVHILAHVFGRRLIFPGSLWIIRLIKERELLAGRVKLMVTYHATRSLLRTADGNDLDTVFIDRRSCTTGQTLVVTCEGNAGFYELGSMMTAVRAGYSVFGWNRPGFGESSVSQNVERLE